MFNSFGNIFRLTSFGESHGPGVGGVIDGFPAGIKVDMDFVQQELNRRRPGQSLLTTSRKEPDTVEFLFRYIRRQVHRLPHRICGMEQEPTFKRLREYQESVPPFTRRLYLYAKIRNP